MPNKSCDAKISNKPLMCEADNEMGKSRCYGCGHASDQLALLPAVREIRSGATVWLKRPLCPACGEGLTCRPPPCNPAPSPFPSGNGFDSALPLHIVFELDERRFPPPWTVETIPGGLKVSDVSGQSLAYVHLRENANDAHMAKVLTVDEARRMVSNIAKNANLTRPSGLRAGSRGSSYTMHPSSCALSFASLQAAVRTSARVIERRLSSFFGKLISRS
jgi:hypothetical protein